MKADILCCPECDKEGMRDTGGFYSWGDSIVVPCDHAILKEGIYLPREAWSDFGNPGEAPNPIRPH